MSDFGPQGIPLDQFRLGCRNGNGRLGIWWYLWWTYQSRSAYLPLSNGCLSSFGFTGDSGIGDVPWILLEKSAGMLSSIV